MSIRINIPAWGVEEAAAGAAALLHAPSSASWRAALADAISREIPGWRAVPMASGRAALAAALVALDLSGRRVAVPAYVCPSVLTGIRAARAHAVFVDCAPESTRFEPRALERAVEAGAINGIIAANTYGISQDFALLRALRLPIVDDAAYQLGRLDRDGVTPCGIRGAAGVFSVNFKAMSGVGGGLLVVRSDQAVASLPPRSAASDASRFFNYLVRSIGRHRIPAFLGQSAPEQRSAHPRAAWLRFDDGGMSSLQAGVALAQWRRRQILAAAQQANAEAILAAAAASPLVEVPGDVRASELTHMVPLLVRHGRESGARAALRRRFQDIGVQTEQPYPVDSTTAANARALADRLVLLPCNATLGPRLIDRIVAGLAAA